MCAVRTLMSDVRHFANLDEKKKIITAATPVIVCLKKQQQHPLGYKGRVLYMLNPNPPFRPIFLDNVICINNKRVGGWGRGKKHLNFEASLGGIFNFLYPNTLPSGSFFFFLKVEKGGVWVVVVPL